MLIPFNSPCPKSTPLEFPWQEDEDIDNRGYWPGWSPIRKIGGIPWDIGFWFRVSVDSNIDANELILESTYFSARVADQPGSFMYHRRYFDTGGFEKYVNVTDMMETVQHNYWSFRHLYWRMLARSSLKYKDLQTQK